MEIRLVVGIQALSIESDRIPLSHKMCMLCNYVIYAYGRTHAHNVHSIEFLLIKSLFDEDLNTLSKCYIYMNISIYIDMIPMYHSGRQLE